MCENNDHYRPWRWVGRVDQNIDLQPQILRPNWQWGNWKMFKVSSSTQKQCECVSQIIWYVHTNGLFKSSFHMVKKVGTHGGHENLLDTFPTKVLSVTELCDFSSIVSTADWRWRNLLIHSANPQSRPVVIIVFARTSVLTYQNKINFKRKQYSLLARLSGSGRVDLWRNFRLLLFFLANFRFAFSVRAEGRMLIREP